MDLEGEGSIYYAGPPVRSLSHESNLTTSAFGQEFESTLTWPSVAVLGFPGQGAPALPLNHPMAMNVVCLGRLLIAPLRSSYSISSLLQIIPPRLRLFYDIIL